MNTYLVYGERGVILSDVFLGIVQLEDRRDIITESAQTGVIRYRGYTYKKIKYVKALQFDPKLVVYVTPLHWEGIND